MDLFLHEWDLRHERVNIFRKRPEALKRVSKFRKIFYAYFFNKSDGGEIFYMSSKQKH